MDKTTQSNDGIDITSFDSVSDAEAGAEIEMKNPDGITGTGVFFTILGENAEPVVRWLNAILNKSNKERALALRSGKPVEQLTQEESTAQNIEGAMIRVTGWRGPKQAFDQALLKRVLTRNPHWVSQIIAESRNAGNFSKARQAS